MVAISLPLFTLCRAAMFGPNPFGLHTDMFIPAIRGQGTPEQVTRLLPAANSFKYIGTYAQTEMGHGQYYTIYEDSLSPNSIHSVLCCSDEEQI